MFVAVFYGARFIASTTLRISRVVDLYRLALDQYMRSILLIACLMASHLISGGALAGSLKIEFTADDSYSVQVARVNVGDKIEWLPTNEGHNVEFLAGPKTAALPEKSEIDAAYSFVFRVPGIYLYGCTPHGNMGMLGLIIVGNDYHNVANIKNINLSPVAKSVLKRLLITAQPD